MNNEVFLDLDSKGKLIKYSILGRITYSSNLTDNDEKNYVVFSESGSSNKQIFISESIMTSSGEMLKKVDDRKLLTEIVEYSIENGFVNEVML